MPPTPEQVIERIFTTENPATGSQPPAQVAWVVFANGTAFFNTPSDVLPLTSSLDTIGDAGREALRELGPVIAGSEAADFNPVRLAGWYPDDPVWFVGYVHPAIATVVISDGESLAAGIEGRTRRQRDFEDQIIVAIRGYDGATRHP